ncbi:hypothetical protein [Defluviimonas denitrificans]|uniref:hypothetical protein n=1 Tax=Albidovulum denitrificans TaxID=404881 RepID=UPI0011B0722F|nr:hypothetical protein [Defluviimonas denitrificans]
MKSKTLFSVSAGVISFALACPVFSQESHTFNLRVACRKPADGRGCTADNIVCANAPQGKYFAAGQSTSGEIASINSPRTHWCREATTGGQGVPVGGLLAPTSMCASLHAESGGGYDQIGQEFYIDCSYTTTVYQIPSE